ncbi:MAG: AI-2E family transporter [Thermoleophilia bacterium]|nr:AI-2E family transporter [Thermoleophilia bacterium]
MRDTARRAFVASLVVGAVLVLALALWKLRILIALVFLAFIVAAAMRPGVDALRRRHVPRAIGIAVHYLGLAAFVALLLALVVPVAVDQVQEAIDRLPTSGRDLRERAETATGFEHELLVGLQRALEDLPRPRELVDPALELTFLGFEIALGIFFTLASAAYWIYERDRAVALVTALVPPHRRRVVRDTWTLIDLKLGAYVRGQMLLVVLVGTVLSALFWAIGLPLWLLVGVFAGVVELIPVIGPLTAGALAVGIGLSESLAVAAAAGLIVLVVRLIEDYLVIPRVLGEAVGLSPLLVLFSVAAVAILFGEFTVLLAIPIAAVVATLIDVVVLNKNPAEQEVPTVLFPAQDAETVGRG